MYSASTTDTDRGLLLHSRRSFCLGMSAIATGSVAFGWLPAYAAVSAETPSYGGDGTAGPVGTKDIGILVAVSRYGSVYIQKGSNVEEQSEEISMEEQEDYEEESMDYNLPSDEAELERFETLAIVLVNQEEVIVIVGEKVDGQRRWWRYAIARSAYTDADMGDRIGVRDAGIGIVVTTDREFQFLKDAAIEGQRVEEYDEIHRSEERLRDQDHRRLFVFVSKEEVFALGHANYGGTWYWSNYTFPEL